MKIIHLSDLHIGMEGSIEKTKFLIKEVNNLKPDVVVITGDLTENGYLKEYLITQKLLKKLKAKPLCVPGNHDARRAGIQLFEKYINKALLIKKIKDVSFFGFNSTMPDVNEGMIGATQHDWCKELMKEPNLKVVLMHHHLLPVPGTGSERNILYDAGDVLKTFIKCDVNLVLCGHRHNYNVWLIENLVVVNCATSTSRDLILENRNSYNIIELTKNRIKVDLKELKGKRKTLVDIKPDRLAVCKVR